MEEIDFKKRRHLLGGGLGAALFFTTFAAKAAAPFCGLTPSQTEGPFYPESRKEDEDADLTQNERALGRIIFVEGVVTDENCQPISGALVEVWQACASGRYDHSGDPNPAPLDPNFQYWGRAVTKSDGSYRFKTILPGAYPAAPGWERPPHIHFKITKIGYRELTTQLYFAGHPLNARDRILKSLTPEEQARVVSELRTKPGDTSPTASFAITLQEL